MTRQSRARALAFATALLVVLLAALFAGLRNLTPAAAPSADRGSAPVESATAGRAAFAALGCANCHSAEGQGNAALPLDGVGRRLDRAALRAASFGSSDRLPAAVAAIKRSRADDPRSETVIDYLQQLP